MKKSLFGALALLPFMVFGQFPSVKSSTKSHIDAKEMTLVEEDGRNVLTTKKKFKDFELYFEFSGKGEAELLLEEGVEVKLGFSYGEEASPEICGAVNEEIAPISNASRESGTQKMRLSFQKLGGEKGLLSIWLNEKLIQKKLRLEVESNKSTVFEFVAR